MRTIGITYLLWFFFGILGVHRFYCGRIGTGFLWFFTAGLLGIGWLVDAFLIPEMVVEANQRHDAFGRRYEVQTASTGAGYGAPPFGAPVAVVPPPGGPKLAASRGFRVVYCTRCGGAMQVPSDSAGAAFACPSCRNVLEIPA